jgi:hypothetical protein
VQAVARGAARCALHVHGRGARADICGLSFAVLSTQVSTVGLLQQDRRRPTPRFCAEGAGSKTTAETCVSAAAKLRLTTERLPSCSYPAAAAPQCHG